MKLTYIIILVTILINFTYPSSLLPQTFNGDENELFDNNNNIDLTVSSIGITGATILSFFVDNYIRDEVIGANVNTKSTVMKIGHTYGDFYYNIGFAGILYSTILFSDKNKIALVGKSLFESLLAGGLASISIKYIFGRTRPYKDKGNTQFNWFETKNIYNSLPSGHVITAFTMSTVLSNYIDNIYASVALYSLASLTATQRIASDNHWFSDVFLGAGIGIISGFYFSNLNKANFSNSSSIHLIPFVSIDNSGFYLFLEI